MRPVIVATAACQFPQPSGVKIQAMRFPIVARIELSSSSTIPKPPFSKPKAWRNQRRIAERRITVPAFFMKEPALSATLLRM